MALEFTITKDGSHTLYNAELDETYHSRHGAIQEAEHVFLKSGLDLLKEKPSVSIFEMGFGTGLNAFMTYLHVKQSRQKIQYFGLESTPVTEAVWKNLNYLDGLNAQNEQAVFNKMHSSSWEKPEDISPNFELTKIKGDLQTFKIDQQVDLIYFDAFGPRVQPHLWRLEVFEKMKMLLKPSGILVTYSCKGDVKRAMIAAGLQVEKIPGPPGKREMLRAKNLS